MARRGKKDTEKTLELVMWLIIGIPMVIIAIIKWIFSGLTKLGQQRTINLSSIDLEEVDQMDGFSFEYFVAELLKKNGYNQVVVTSGSGDFGVDITAYKDNKKHAFQCKNYQSKLGVSPIQEVYSGAPKYNASICVVVTNSYFTPHAQELARHLNVILWDRSELVRLIRTEKESLLINQPIQDYKLGEVQEVPPKKPFPIKIVLCSALVLSLILNIILLCSKNSASCFEGNGFSSPEAAITAYAKAFKEGDINEMISTFAVESYVDCFDLEEHMALVWFYQFYNTEVGLPNDSNYKEQINYYSRTAYITQQIKNGYFTLTGVDNSKSIQSFPRDTREADIDALMQQLEYPEFDKKLSHIKIGDVLTKNDFKSNENYSQMLNNYPHLDVDELCDVAIEIEFDGEQYYLFMLTAKINGKWYNISFVSPLGLLNGLDSSSGGFMKQ